MQTTAYMKFDIPTYPLASPNVVPDNHPRFQRVPRFWSRQNLRQPPRPAGSSRNFMGRGEKIESAAVEEDSGGVVEGVTEATGIGLEGLDFGVEPFSDCVGDGKKREVDKSLQMLGEHRDGSHRRIFELHQGVFSKTHSPRGATRPLMKSNPRGVDDHGVQSPRRDVPGEKFPLRVVASNLPRHPRRVLSPHKRKEPALAVFTLPDPSCRDAAPNFVWRNTFRHHCASSNHRALADIHSLEDNHIRAYPNMFSTLDRGLWSVPRR